RIGRNLSSGRHGVGVEINVGIARNLSDFRDRLDRSYLRVRVHARDQDRIVANRPPDILRIDQSVSGYRQPCYFIPLLLEVLARVENRVMLDLRGDDVAALRLLRLGDAANGKVIRLRSAADENDFGGLRIDQFRDMLASIIDQRLRVLSEPMDGRLIAE